MQEMQSKAKKDERQLRKKVWSEWKFAATVIDRFCFCLFTLFFVAATIAVFRHQLLPSNNLRQH